MSDEMMQNDPAQREDIINHSSASDYVAPDDPLLQQRLSWFQDQKLALMVHWGGYSQWGICESWPLSDGDADWARKGLDWEKDPDAFRKQYFDLNRTFNPVRFDPDEWADFAQEVGFRYFIFTTKHHDGFCMYDTKQTDYKTTGEDCPFHMHRYADIARHLFDAFRARDIGIAAYFSKSDWHCPWYWAKGQKYPVAYWRNPTYDPLEKPELWEQFTLFAQAQMLELVRDYGPVDILWLDGGQVNPRTHHQDIRMDDLAKAARAITPGLLIADRTVGGPHENYITPEQTIPDSPILVPWESCVTIGTSFSFRFDDDYKSPRDLVFLLTETVSKGGNLALNIGAQPDGRLPRHAVESARGLGEWLSENGPAIFSTRPCPPYVQGAYAFTKKDSTVYAILRLKEGETLPEQVVIPYQFPVSRVETLMDGRPLPFTRVQTGLEVMVPRGIVGQSPLAQVFVLRG